MSRRCTAIFPEDGGATEMQFKRFLSKLPRIVNTRVIDAILSLEDNPRPGPKSGLLYIQTRPERVLLMLRMLPGKPFNPKRGAVYNDYAYARHHITVSGVTVLYDIKDERYVVLMGIRFAT